jgi:DNA polymerase-1
MGRFKVLPPTMKVRTKEQAEKALKILRGTPEKPTRVIAVDTETTGLSRHSDYAVIISISSGWNRFAIWPEAFYYFVDLLEDPEIKLIMWNANFDTPMLRNVGIDLYRHCSPTHYRVYDAMIMHALSYDDRPHSLKYAAKEYHGIHMVEFSQVFPDYKTRGADTLLDPENEDKVAHYAGLDALATLLLFQSLRPELLATNTGNKYYPTLWDYFIKTEVPFTRVLYECERTGIPLDKEALSEMAPRVDRELTGLMRWFARHTGRIDFNPNSAAHLGDLFFTKLGHEVPSYTATGQPQVQQKWLQKIAANGDRFAAKVLDFKDLNKKAGTYIRGLVKLLADDGCIHTTFNQAGARTGRLSSKDPNLQNQPPYIRSAYVAPPGMKLFARDYSQLEMRILAHFSRDEALVNAINEGKDVHSTCAAMMFGTPYEDIMAARGRDDEIDAAKKAGEPFAPLTPYEEKCLKQRKAAKAINFGLVYGMGAQKLAIELRIPVEEAKSHIAAYFEAFPGIKAHFHREINKAYKTGTCSTLMGRIRQVPGILSVLRGDVATAERRIKNTPIQGTGADITKLAMIRIYEDDVLRRMGYRMVLNVHDEIVGLVPEELEHNEEFNNRFQDLMEHPLPFDLVVPLETTGKYGVNWLETK